MTAISTTDFASPQAESPRPKLDHPMGIRTILIFLFAMLIAAIIWNLGTWWLGLPASSSHTLIGSIIGVGMANALMRGRDGTSGRQRSAMRSYSLRSSGSSVPHFYSYL
jgi:Phosphate transporter family